MLRRRAPLRFCLFSALPLALVALLTLGAPAGRAGGPQMVTPFSFQVGSLSEALADPTPTPLPPAQSTTGPIPPAGVRAQGLGAASSAAVTIPGVPAYLWRHGCGPTAAGMILGYWDGQGFDSLMPGNASVQTAAVDCAIAGEGPASHYTDYCEPLDEPPGPLLPDSSEDPPGDEHADNCIADFMRTSQSHSGNYYGWSWSNDIGPALVNYARLRGGGSLVLAYRDYNVPSDPNAAWSLLQREINARRPLVLLVDTQGYGSTDHFVTAIGYDTVGGQRRYACLNTWDRDVHWYAFAPMAVGVEWGVYSLTTFQISGGPTATPTITRTPTRTPSRTPTPTVTRSPTKNLTPLSKHVSLPVVLRHQAGGRSIFPAENTGAINR